MCVISLRCEARIAGMRCLTHRCHSPRVHEIHACRGCPARESNRGPSSAGRNSRLPREREREHERERERERESARALVRERPATVSGVVVRATRRRRRASRSRLRTRGPKRRNNARCIGSTGGTRDYGGYNTCNLASTRESAPGRIRPAPARERVSSSPS